MISFNSINFTFRSWRNEWDWIPGRIRVFGRIGPSLKSMQQCFTVSRYSKKAGCALYSAYLVDLISLPPQFNFQEFWRLFSVSFVLIEAERDYRWSSHSSRIFYEVRIINLFKFDEFSIISYQAILAFVRLFLAYLNPFSPLNPSCCCYVRFSGSIWLFDISIYWFRQIKKERKE